MVVLRVSMAVLFREQGASQGLDNAAQMQHHNSDFYSNSDTCSLLGLILRRFNVSYKDLRDFLEAVEARGELKHISGAHWNLEMSGIAELVHRGSREPKPAIMFDEIPDYPKDYRTLFGFASSP